MRIIIVLLLLSSLLFIYYYYYYYYYFSLHEKTLSQRKRAFTSPALFVFFGPLS